MYCNASASSSLGYRKPVQHHVELCRSEALLSTRLRLYRGALRLCGAASIAALTDETESRRLLDEVWDDDGVRRVLESGLWNFAMRTQQLDFDPAVDPAFGYVRAFEKGTDWVRTAGVWSDENLESPLVLYQDETDFLYSDLDTIYVQFVSDHAEVGGDLSTWPGSFSDYAEAYFASKVVHRLTSDKERLLLLLGPPGRPDKGILERALKNARSKDAMRDPAKALPPGTWTSSRSRAIGRRGPLGDGGTPGSLTG